MSPGATMERVYLELKARIMAGDFAPGERLDPSRLAENLAASATPVRDALHRLSGERLIESWQHEGFRQPITTDADLRDLYIWAEATLFMALRVPNLPPAMLDPTPERESYADRIARLFHAIAALSANREIRYAINNLTDRSHIVRAAELQVDPDLATDLSVMESSYSQAEWPSLRGSISRFHRGRIRSVGQIASRLRPRD